MSHCRTDDVCHQCRNDDVCHQCRNDDARHQCGNDDARHQCRNDDARHQCRNDDACDQSRNDDACDQSRNDDARHQCRSDDARHQYVTDQNSTRVGQAEHQIFSHILHSTLPQHLVQGVTSVDRHQAPVCTCSTSVSNHRCVPTAAKNPLADQWNAGAVRHAFPCTMYTTVLMSGILSNENFYRSARDAVAQSGFLAHMRSWGEGGEE